MTACMPSTLKKCTVCRLQVNFIWGKVRRAAWETAPEVALRDYSQEADWGRSIHSGEGGVHVIRHRFL